MIKKITCILVLILISFSTNYPHPNSRDGKLTFSKTTDVVKTVQFLPAYQAVRSWEGNYSNHPNDRGGETYSGISRIYNPDWYGWIKIDEYKDTVTCPFNHKHYHHCFQPKWNQQLGNVVEHFVLDHYIDIWFKEGFDQLSNQETANYLFDFRINGTIAPKLTQRVIKQMGVDVILNNKMTPDLALIINKLDQDDFINRLKIVRGLFYKNIARNHPDQRIFLKEWLKRTHKGGTIRQDV